MKIIDETTGNVGSNLIPFTFNSTGFRGVHWDGQKNAFVAEIGNNRKGNRKRLGRFPTARLAAEAYDVAAIERYGAAAVLNFPLGNYRTAIPMPGGSKPECVHGHRLDLANKYIAPDGHINCRTCNRIAAARCKERKS